jgi:hypothetical protein
VVLVANMVPGHAVALPPDAVRQDEQVPVAFPAVVVTVADTEHDRVVAGLGLGLGLGLGQAGALHSRASTSLSFAVQGLPPYLAGVVTLKVASPSHLCHRLKHRKRSRQTSCPHSPQGKLLRCSSDT